VLFNSVPFAIFFPAVLALYWLLRTPRRQNALLVVASLFFYGWWDWRFVSLLLLSVVVDYFCALWIERARAGGSRGRAGLVTSLVVNLGILGVFKYYDFFIESAEALWISLGWRPDLLDVVLPVGISFYTFQTLSYTIDVYRGQFEARRSFIDVAAYVTFFPQLVAGPIERAPRLIPQMERPRRLGLDDIQLGVMLMLTGFIKKMLLADGVAPIVEWSFGRAALGQEIGGAAALVGVLAFGVQIYGDFSGYSDIARGAARLLGFDLVINFRQPNFSRSFSELFERWHISLSTWLRDYLFISLGGSRGGLYRAARNLAITMVLAGLWHGAAWTFAIWGAVMGLFLASAHLLGLGQPARWSRWRQALGLATTFAGWHLSGFLFRAQDIATSGRLYASLVSWEAPFPVQQALVAFGALAVVVLIDLPHVLHPDEELPAARRTGWMLFTMAVAICGFWTFPPLKSQPFIYFQF
jgi:D-alanyl-lipoteichoic acid acyltransferase DltB (MBOAT superfamily)